MGVSFSGIEGDGAGGETGGAAFVGGVALLG